MTKGKENYSVFFLKENNLQKERVNMFKRTLKLRRGKKVVREPPEALSGFLSLD